MCLAQGHREWSDASEARTRSPLVSSQALYHCAPIANTNGKLINRAAAALYKEAEKIALN